MNVIQLANKINKGFRTGGSVTFEEKEISYIGKVLNLLVKQYGITENDTRETSKYKACYLYEVASHYNATVEKAKKSGQVEPLKAKELSAIADILETIGNGKGLGFTVVKPNNIIPKKEEPKATERKIIGYSAWIKANCEDECVGYAMIKKYGDNAESVADDMANCAADGSDEYWTRPIYGKETLYISDEYSHLM